MKGRQLSPDIVSLIHHVELNESGWWKKSVTQIVKGVLWKSGKPQDFDALKKSIFHEVGGIALSDEELEKQLGMLSESGAVARLPDSTYKLTERAFKELTKANALAQAEQAECREGFINSCAKYCPNLDSEKAWRGFTQALNKAIHVSGANLYQLLVGGNLRRDFDWLSGFVGKMEPEHREGIRKVLMDFFDPSNQACRNQILRFMSAYFFAEATQLRPETVDSINKARKARSIKVVLDTNFIFSILQLHDNPADDAAKSLIEIARSSKGKLDLKLYVLPGTLDEAKRVLVSQVELLQRIRATIAVSRAAVSQSLPSIAKKFFTKAVENPGLTAEAYFQPYIEGLRFILESKGISVLDAARSIYSQRQDVIDDVLQEMEREKKLPEGRRKNYEAVLHDATLWHAVNDRRQANADSPFEIEYWAVSIDWRLIGFDRAKRVSKGMPVILHPSNLVQLIQFWIPRTPRLEESLVDALRLPLFFQSFDPEDEKATIKVLETLSRFENIDDLPESIIRVVLANQALRSKLRIIEASNDKVFELVREEIIVQHRQVLDQLDEVKKTNEKNVELLDKERQARESAESHNQEVIQKFKVIEEGKREIESKWQEDRDRAERAEQALERLKFVAWFLLLPVMVGALLSFSIGFVGERIVAIIPNGSILTRVGIIVFLTPVALAFCVLPGYVSRRAGLQAWWVSKSCSFVGAKFVLAPLGLGFNAIYSGGVWDVVKPYLGLGG